MVPFEMTTIFPNYLIRPIEDYLQAQSVFDPNDMLKSLTDGSPIHHEYQRLDENNQCLYRLFQNSYYRQVVKKYYKLKSDIKKREKKEGKHQSVVTGVYHVQPNSEKREINKLQSEYSKYLAKQINKGVKKRMFQYKQEERDLLLKDCYEQQLNVESKDEVYRKKSQDKRMPDDPTQQAKRRKEKLSIKTIFTSADSTTRNEWITKFLFRNSVKFNGSKKKSDKYSMECTQYLVNARDPNFALRMRQRELERANLEQTVGCSNADQTQKVLNTRLKARVNRLKYSPSDPILETRARGALLRMQRQRFGSFVPFATFLNFFQTLRAKMEGDARRRGYVVPRKELAYRPIDLMYAKSEISFILDRVKASERLLSLSKADNYDARQLRRQTNMIRIDGIRGEPGITAAAKHQPHPTLELIENAKFHKPSTSYIKMKKPKLRSKKREMNYPILLASLKTKKSKKVQTPICRRIKRSVWNAWAAFVSSICSY